MLVVDDRPINLQILENSLLNWGAKSRSFTNPYEAVEWVKKGEPIDLILTDLDMPGMDGSQLLREIHKIKGTTVPAMILTSVSWPARPPESAIVASKPIREGDLARAISGLLEGHAARYRTVRSRNTIPRFADFPAKILVVEDNAVNQRLMRLMLNQMGLEANYCTTGKESVIFTMQLEPDIVFMDVRLPEMDGYEATSRIRQMGDRIKQPRIIGLTANALADEKAKGIAAGMDDYLTKPILRQDLFKALLENCRLTHGEPQLTE